MLRRGLGLADHCRVAGVRLVACALGDQEELPGNDPRPHDDELRCQRRRHHGLGFLAGVDAGRQPLKVELAPALLQRLDPCLVLARHSSASKWL